MPVGPFIFNSQTRRPRLAGALPNLAALVHELEDSDAIELTRRGEPVAVLLSMRSYQQLTAPRGEFWDAYQSFRRAFPLAKLNIQPEVFENVRDTTPGREVQW